MTTHLAAIAYLVRDYDEAINWFTAKLGFAVLEDTALSDTKRWVRVAANTGSISLLLAKAEGDEQNSHVGKAAGSRVAYFLHTDDFATTHAKMQSSGVAFTESPRHEAYGTVAVFTDLYGNKWDLVGPKTQPTTS